MPFSMPVPLHVAELRTDGVARAYFRRLPLSLLCWTGVVLLEASQVFVNDASRGYVLSALHYLAWPIFNWFIFAFISPFIYELGLRYPIVGQHWVRRVFLPHSLVYFACLVAQGIFRGFA